MKRVYCLYRVSTKGQVEKDDIPMQKTACQTFAEENGWIIQKEFSEKGVSGFKVSANERDAIQDLKVAATKKEFDILLVFMFDRLGRREDETPFVVEWFVKNGIEVWSVKEGEQRFDSHVDKLTNYIRYWQAGGESRKTSTRVKTRMNQLTEEGVFTGGVIPLGYRLIPSGEYSKKGKERMKVVIDTAEAEIVTRIFDMTINQGYGSHRLAEWLNNQGFRTHKGSLFQSNTVIRILKNKMYCGYFIKGEAISGHIPELQLIEPSTYNQVQFILEQRAGKNQEKQQIALHTKGRTMLSGNLYCEHCSGKMIATSYTDKYYHVDGTLCNVRRERYVCYNKVRNCHNCEGQSAYVSDRVDALVGEKIESIFAKLESTSPNKLLKQKYIFQKQSLHKQEKSLEKKVREGKLSLAKLSAEIGQALLGKSKFTPDILSTAMEQLQLSVSDSEEKLFQLRTKLENETNLIKDMNHDFQQLIIWANSFSEAELDEKKMILCRMVREVRLGSHYQIELLLDEKYQRFID